MFELDLLCFDEPFRFCYATMEQFAHHTFSVAFVIETHPLMSAFLLLDLKPGEPAYINTVDVHPAQRRLGLGRALLDAAEGAASAREAKFITLHVSTENEAALRLYESCGYRKTHKRVSFYGDGLHAFFLEKALKS